MKIISTLAGCVIVSATMSAELNPLFQDNAVLQCGVRVPVWGTARDGEKITVTFAGQKVSTVASNGVRKIWLKPMKPDATSKTLSVLFGAAGLAVVYTAMAVCYHGHVQGLPMLLLVLSAIACYSMSLAPVPIDYCGRNRRFIFFSLKEVS